jgi:steroid delta-isomerase-like uncharacterized protein
MMTDAEQLVRRFFDAFNSSDRKQMLDLVHDDMILDVNQHGREIGKDSFNWFLAGLVRHYSDYLTDIVIMSSPDHSRVSAECTVRGTYLTTAEGLPEATGQSFSLPIGFFFEIDDNLITRMTMYYNLNEWIRQVSDRRDDSDS